MRRRMMSLLMALVMVMALLPGEVLAAETNIITYGNFKFDPATGTITGPINTSIPTADIPETIPVGEGNIKVTAIADEAFMECTNLTSVTIPQTVTNIGTSAFSGCSKLTTVTFWEGGSSLTIEERAFEGCSSLSKITLPSIISKISEYTFASCTSLTSIAVPANVTTIDAYAFYKCTRLSIVSLPGGISTVAGSAFSNCSQLKILHYNGDEASIPSALNNLAGEGKPIEKIHTTVSPSLRPKAATCTEPGSNTDEISCETCGKTIITSEHQTPALGHKLEYKDAVDVTCTTAGKTALTYCTRSGCDYQIGGSVIPATGHKFEITEDTPHTTTKAANCKEAGIETYTIECSNDGCNETTTREVVIPKTTTHTYDGGSFADKADWIVLKEPTCTEEGKSLKVRVCDVCGEAEVITEEHLEKEHANGQGCSEHQIDTITATGHKYDEKKYTEIADVPADFDCEEGGTIKVYFICDVCGEQDTTASEYTLAKGQHTYKETEDLTKEATCTEDGEKTIHRKCEICGDKPDDEVVKIPALGHDFDESIEGNVVTTPATCENAGKKVITCSRAGCNVTKEVEIPKLAHEQSKEHPDAKVLAVRKEATCAEDGYEKWWVLCDHKTESTGGGSGSGTNPDPTPDPDPAPEPGKDPDDENSGGGTDDGSGGNSGNDNPDLTRQTREAEDGDSGSGSEGDSSTDDPEDSNVPETGIGTQNPPKDYESEGYHWYLIEEEISALGHLPSAPDLENAETIKEPTCTENGIRVVTTVCQRDSCGEVLQDTPFPIPALGHDFGEWTTGSNNVRTRTCTRCGEVQKDGGDDSDSSGDTNKPNDPNKPSDPGTTTPSDYAIRVIRPSNGKSKASASSAVSGTSITLTFTPNDGYELDSVRVTRTSTGKTVTVSKTATNRYTFTMPAANVEVRADFTAIPNYTAGSSSGASTPVSQRNQSTSVIQSSPQVSVSSQLYADVSTSHWAAGEITWVSQRGYMSGSGNSFKPDGGITQQQMWMVLARAMGQNPSSMAAANQWAVINGFAEGGNPTAVVTRQQLVKALFGTARLMGSTNRNVASLGSYADYRTVSSSCRDAMGWAVANGIISGNSHGRLNPNGTVTRAQFAVILYRFYQRAF